MSIFDIFRSQPAQPQQQTQQAPATQPQQPAPQGSSMQNLQGQMNQQDPNNTQVPPANQPPDALDVLAGLWNNDTNGEEDSFDPQKMFNIDAAQIGQAVSQLNFTDGIPDEVLQKVVSGGEGAIQAMRQVLNYTTQQAFAKGMVGNTTLMQQAFGKAHSAVDKQIARSVRTSQASTSVREVNPIFNDPMYAPMLKVVEEQLVRKYPQASPTEIAGMANQYIQGMVKAASPPPSQQEQRPPVSQDWDRFLTGQTN